MADIELVIKISKAYYELVLERCKDPVLLNAFKNGIQLPKGHGRLIDADALKNEWKNGFHKKIVDALMDDALTIIEAESGETK